MLVEKTTAFAPPTLSGVFSSSLNQQEAEQGADVERINQYSMYELGQALKGMARFNGELKPNFDILFAAWDATEKLALLLDGNPIPIVISRPSAEELKALIDKLINDTFYKQGDDGNPVFKPIADTDPPIPSYVFSNIDTLLSKFETIFNVEMREAATYYVPRRGIFSTPALVDHADESFPPDLMASVPDKTKSDWRAAGRCLAFYLLTASGFHACRAVEGTLEIYYKHFSGKDKTLNGWGEYITELQKIIDDPDASAKPSKKTMTEIKQMKDDFRNPVMHPRVVLNEGDARILYDNSESLIITMLQEIAT